jgi:endonuclease/exonuclease/phosphatase family metal-dependent hydrolase
MKLRIATYNVHKCRGLDRRVRPARIASVLREVDADVVALQEVVSHEEREREQHQARFIAEELGYSYHVGECRRHQGGAYGNVTLTRLPVVEVCNYDITWRWQEPRGCLRVDVKLGAGDDDDARLHVFNAHLGTAFIERRQQGRKLVGDSVLRNDKLTGPRVVVGDFNEWTRGLASRLLAEELQSADVRRHLRRARTYPGPLPILHLDHVYYDPALRLERLWLHKSLTALVASDHLPLVADFTIQL